MLFLGSSKRTIAESYKRFYYETWNDRATHVLSNKMIVWGGGGGGGGGRKGKRKILPACFRVAPGDILGVREGE